MYLVGLADRADVAVLAAAGGGGGGADPEPDVALVRAARRSCGCGGEGEDGRVGPLKVPRVQAEHLVAVPGRPAEKLS